MHSIQEKKKMVNKSLKYIVGLLVFMLTMPIMAQQKTDSLIINVGSSKVIILVNDPKDLDQLASYDLNAILKDLRMKLTSDSTILDENQQAVSDTTIVVDQSTEVEEESDDNKRWESDDRWRDRDDDRWEEKSDDSWRNYSTSSVKRISKSSRHFLNFDLGTNNYLNNGEFPESSNAQYAVRPWGSWYFAINSVYQKQIKNRFYIEIGPGISWYNFKFQDDNTRVTEVDGVTNFIPDNDPERDYKKSKLTAAFVNVTVVPMIQFGSKRKKRSVGNWNSLNSLRRDIRIGGSEGGFRFGVGGYAGYRIASRSKVKFEGGKKDKDRDNFNLTSLRYGVRVQMGFKGTDLFFNYDLNELFNAGRGPDLNAFSFGIIL